MVNSLSTFLCQRLRTKIKPKHLLITTFSKLRPYWIIIPHWVTHWVVTQRTWWCTSAFWDILCCKRFNQLGNHWNRVYYTEDVRGRGQRWSHRKSHSVARDYNEVLKRFEWIQEEKLMFSNICVTLMRSSYCEIHSTGFTSFSPNDPVAPPRRGHS